MNETGKEIKNQNRKRMAQPEFHLNRAGFTTSGPTPMAAKTCSVRMRTTGILWLNIRITSSRWLIRLPTA